MATQTNNVRRAPSGRYPGDGIAGRLQNLARSDAFKTVTIHPVAKSILLLSAFLLPVISLAGSIPSAEMVGRPAPSWSVAVTGGFSNTFQLILGGKYGEGPDFQNKLTAGVNNAFLKGDNMSMFGWSTADVPSATPNWQAGLLYRLPLLRRRNNFLSVTGSGQRWILPMVGHGTKDWFVIGNMTYGTSVRRIPVFISEDSYSLVKSNLPTGHALYSQIYTQQPLLYRHGLRLALREGPAYTYSWGLYGCSGNRVVRYGGTLISSWKSTTLEAGYCQQFGLQDKIPNNRYWSLLVTRQFGGSFHGE
jgi:hypothetical protein